MNKLTQKFLLHLFFCLLLLIAGCKKNEATSDDEPFVPPNVTTPPYSFSRYDANGLLKIQRIYAYYNDPLTGLVETISKQAQATFKVSAFDTEYCFAGSVSCQGKSLSYQSNRSYLVDGSSAASINFGDTIGVSWNISGNVPTDMPTFIYLTSEPMPVFKGISNNSIPGNVTRALGTKIYLGANVSGADSVFISISVGEKSITKTVGGSVSFCEFSNTELSVLPASSGESGMIQVSPLKFDVTVQGGKKMYFANQSTYTKLVKVN